jgi:hypothetical protein
VILFHAFTRFRLDLLTTGVHRCHPTRLLGIRSAHRRSTKGITTPTRTLWALAIRNFLPQVSVNTFLCTWSKTSTNGSHTNSSAPFKLAELTKEYGPVFSIRQGPRLFVVIGRYQAAMEIMEKEGASLADRPRLIAAAETLSGGMRVVSERSGDRLRRVRK